MKDDSNDLPFDLNAFKDSFKNVKHWSELTKEGGPFQLMFKSTIERLMKAELEEHLGYYSGDTRTKNTDNCRNGSYKKKIRSSSGEVDIDVPRDRKSEYQPKIIPKWNFPNFRYRFSYTS